MNKLRPFVPAIRTSSSVFTIVHALRALSFSMVCISLLFLTGCTSSTQGSPEEMTPAQPSISNTEPADIIPTNTASLAEGQDAPASKTPTPDAPNPTATSYPTSTPPLLPELPEICQPFPSDIYGINLASTGGFFVHARCNGEDVSFPSPVGRASFLDYTSLTGRMAYSQSIRLPSDQSSLGGDVWVYDFWTGEKTMWLDEGVTAASWAPVRDPTEDSQYLAILEVGGTLSLMSTPFSSTELGAGDNICWFSWSPLGDQLVYVKDCSEISDGFCYRYTAGTSYLMMIHGGQPRKLADGTSGIPIWALDYQALIIPGSTVKIYHLEEAKSYPLMLPNGEPLDGTYMGGFRWSPFNRFLFMSQNGCFDHVGWWMAELCEDLNHAINFTMMVHTFDFQYSSRDVLLIRSPSDGLEYLGKILSLKPNSLRMSIVLREMGVNGFGDILAMFGEDSLIIDAQGNSTDYSALAEGMYIDVLGHTLSPDTLTLIATQIHIVAPASKESTYQAEIIRMHPDLHRATIQITDPDFSIFCDQRGLAMTPESQIVDEVGNSITFQDLREGMSIEVVGPSLASDPFSILATTIRVLNE